MRGKLIFCFTRAEYIGGELTSKINLSIPTQNWHQLLSGGGSAVVLFIVTPIVFGGWFGFFVLLCIICVLSSFTISSPG